jgi:hypothetical protein
VLHDDGASDREAGGTYQCTVNFTPAPALATVDMLVAKSGAIVACGSVSRGDGNQRQ